jgi:hypothetical protein
MLTSGHFKELQVALFVWKLHFCLYMFAFVLPAAATVLVTTS